MVKFSFNYRNKKFNLDVKELRTPFEMARGLMFNSNPEILLFRFKRISKEAIHSFFCSKFVAIWFNKGKIVDIQRIDRWRIYIVPKENFDILLEIPEKNKYYSHFHRR